ncbi:hypothetical protein BDV95DRAFT_612197 [Massariosphaeria phaeospora]|uniref:Uncharacterized protein n=1 Tax=Massariosphaeria phaeospora TaxID=100035 RepID=A0A7C8M2E8_9PLEO|nr:hypothetical protein BDV95DRAFT_612197 [Massariosphaeria phaeospora]
MSTAQKDRPRPSDSEMKRRNSDSSTHSTASWHRQVASTNSVAFSPALNHLLQGKDKEKRATIMKDIDEMISSYQGLLHTNGDKVDAASRDTLAILNGGDSYKRDMMGLNRDALQMLKNLPPTPDGNESRETSEYPAFKHHEQETFSQYVAAARDPRLQVQSRWSATSASSSTYSVDNARSWYRTDSVSSHGSQATVPELSRSNSNSSSIVPFPTFDLDYDPRYSTASQFPGLPFQHAQTLQAASSHTTPQRPPRPHTPDLTPFVRHARTATAYAPPFAAPVRSITHPFAPYVAPQRLGTPPFAPFAAPPRTGTPPPWMPFSGSRTPTQTPPPLAGLRTPTRTPPPLKGLRTPTRTPPPFATESRPPTPPMKDDHPAFVGGKQIVHLVPGGGSGSNNHSRRNSINTAPTRKPPSHDTTPSPGLSMLASSGASAFLLTTTAFTSPPPLHHPTPLHTTTTTTTLTHEKMMDGRPCKENNYWGFCKGAWTMREDLARGLETQTRPDGLYNSHQIWACRHCHFTGETFSAAAPASASTSASRKGKKDKDAVVTVVDPNIYTSAVGIRYKWAFLAKSHVKLASLLITGGGGGEKDDAVNYGCVVCSVEGSVTGVYGTVETLMKHVFREHVQHGGMDARTAEKVRCVVGRVAGVDEEWDLNVSVNVNVPRGDGLLA